MKHEEYEKQMMDCVNRNCKMKELDRQEVERAAQEEYRFICKCKKINAVISIIVLIACFVATVFAMCVMSWTGFLPAVVSSAVSAVMGLVFGMSINSMANRIKN